MFKPKSSHSSGRHVADSLRTESLSDPLELSYMELSITLRNPCAEATQFMTLQTWIASPDAVDNKRDRAFLKVYDSFLAVYTTASQTWISLFMSNFGIIP